MKGKTNFKIEKMDDITELLYFKKVCYCHHVLSFLRKNPEALKKSLKSFEKDLEEGTKDLEEGTLVYYDPLLFLFTEMVNGKEFKTICSDIKTKIQIYKNNRTNGSTNIKDFWVRNGIDESFSMNLPDKQLIDDQLNKFNDLQLNAKELIMSSIESNQEQPDQLEKLWGFLVDIYLAQVKYFNKDLDKDQRKKKILAVLKPNLRKKMQEILQSELEYLMQCQASNRSEYYLEKEETEKIKQLLYLNKTFKVKSKLPKRFSSTVPDDEVSDEFAGFLLKQSLSLFLESIGTLDLLLEYMKESKDPFVILQFIYPGIPRHNIDSKTFTVVDDNHHKKQQIGLVTVVCGRQDVLSSDLLNRIFNSNKTCNTEATKFKEERNYANLIIASSLFIISLLLLSLSALYYNSRGMHNFFKGNPIKICLNIVLILLPIISFAGMVFAFKSSKSMKKVAQHVPWQHGSKDKLTVKPKETKGYNNLSSLRVKLQQQNL